MANCSDELPYARTYFDDISTAELVCIIISGVFSLFTVVLFCFIVKIELERARGNNSEARSNKINDSGNQELDEADVEQDKKQNGGQEHSGNTQSYDVKVQLKSQSKLQKLIARRNIQVFGILPVISISSMMALCIPRTTHVSHVIVTTYIAVCIYNMASLMINHFCDKEKMYQADNKISLQTSPLCCLLCCLPKVSVTKRNTKRIQFLILQSLIINPLLSLIILVLWLDGHYTDHQSDADEPNQYLNIATTVSNLTALYGLILTGKLCFQHLSKQYRIRFYLFHAVLVVYYIQSFIYAILAGRDIPSCRGSLSPSVRGQGIFNMAVVWEMFILALLTALFNKGGQQE